MKKNLYIHIGVNKTGTTSIQNFLDSNKEFLEKNDILYPDFAKIWSAHFPLAWGLNAGKSPSNYKNIDRVWEKLKEYLDLRSEKNIIISSENFILLRDIKKIEYIKSVFADYNIKVIMFVRSQDLWIESLYLQAIKMGVNVPTFEEYIKRPGQLLDFNEIILPWEKTFSKNNITIVDFDDKKVKSNLIKNFLEIIDSNIDISDIDLLKNENESLTRELAEFLLKYNQYFETQKRLEIISFYNKNIRTKASLNAKYFTDEKRIKFLEKFKQSNQLIEKNYSLGNSIAKYKSNKLNTKANYNENEKAEIIENVIQHIFKKINFNDF